MNDWNEEEMTATMDKITTIGKSTVQHGKANDRIYLMKLHPDDFPAIISDLEKLAGREAYTKIFAKIPVHYAPGFIAEGYQIEGFAPKFFKGTHDALFLGKFFSEKRRQPDKKELTALQSIFSKAAAPVELPPHSYREKRLTIEDIPAIVNLYKVIFPVYPFPIHSPDYIKSTMETHVVYYGMYEGDTLFGIASSEIDRGNLNAEMTDMAVLPKYRGKQISLHLLHSMEREMKTSGMKTLYTIARLKSLGVNITFLKAGYTYSGTLVNNTHISSGIESMNVWYKNIS
jgi:putative beta-lysine N-acetyltransferase